MINKLLYYDGIPISKGSALNVKSLSIDEIISSCNYISNKSSIREKFKAVIEIYEPESSDIYDYTMYLDSFKNDGLTKTDTWTVINNKKLKK